MARRVIGNLFLSAGAAILIVVVGLTGYNAYEEYAIRQAYANSYSSTTGTASPAGEPTTHATTTQPAAVTVTSTSTTTTTVTMAAPSGSPARWLVIPAIGVDTPVVEARLENGQWQVPKFIAGHLQGTAQPGAGHNVAMAGHIQSISSGNVFAELSQLVPGDAITVTTVDGQTLHYAVSAVEQVKNTDLSVVQPGDQETLTLITCSGTWDAAAHDYTERTVAIAYPTP